MLVPIESLYMIFCWWILPNLPGNW